MVDFASQGSVGGDGALQGVGELIAKLRAMKNMDDGKIIRGVARTGIRPAFTAARQNIKIGTEAFRTYRGRLVAPGFAYRNIRIVTTLSGDKQRADALLGVSKEAYYATQFLERGTSKMRAQPWIRSAFFSTKDAQLNRMKDYLNGWLIKLAASKDGKT